MHLQPLIHSCPASLRCAVSLLAIALPSRELAPADVVRAQLEALQANDLQTCYAFASPANRRNIGPWPNLEVIVKRTPTFSPLAGCASFEVLSALSLGDRWTCRVRVAPGDAWRHCMDHSASPAVGESVRLTSDPEHLRRALETVDYSWSELMQSMAGSEVEVLCDSRPNRGTNIVGLPSPDGSQGGVWYFPVTALEKPEGGAEAPAAEHEYLWQLSRQADVEVEHGLGQVIIHRKYGYRGVVVGHDPSCQQDEAWCTQMNVDDLPRGRLQPFYHVLVDQRDREGSQITYVAEENVARPQTYGAFEPVQHPMVPELLRSASFDVARGEYQPNDELRALYPQQVQGCWMVDAVKPDRGAAEAEEEQ